MSTFIRTPQQLTLALGTRSNRRALVLHRLEDVSNRAVSYLLLRANVMFEFELKFALILDSLHI